MVLSKKDFLGFLNGKTHIEADEGKRIFHHKERRKKKRTFSF